MKKSEVDDVSINRIVESKCPYILQIYFKLTDIIVKRI